MAISKAEVELQVGLTAAPGSGDTIAQTSQCHFPDLATTHTFLPMTSFLSCQDVPHAAPVRLCLDPVGE